MKTSQREQEWVAKLQAGERVWTDRQWLTYVAAVVFAGFAAVAFCLALSLIPKARQVAGDSYFVFWLLQPLTLMMLAMCAGLLLLAIWTVASIRNSSFHACPEELSFWNCMGRQSVVPWECVIGARCYSRTVKRGGTSWKAEVCVHQPETERQWRSLYSSNSQPAPAQAICEEVARRACLEEAHSPRADLGWRSWHKEGVWVETPDLPRGR